MEKQESILQLVKRTRNSSFNLNSYNVNLAIHRFIKGLMLHVDYENHRKEIKLSSKELLNTITPAFQRDNNKWSKKMQVSFIENLLSGFDTQLKFFNIIDKVNNKDDNCQIIDGLQRTTAILKFIDGKIKPFGYTYSELINDLPKFNTKLTIAIYDFDNWEAIGRFYIDMNENITHSKKDIKKAKDWFFNTKGIIL